MNARPKDRARARQPAGQRDAPRPNGDEWRIETLVVGVDIGNSTTEACVASIEPLEIAYLGSSLARTTGVKGTKANVAGVVRAIAGALLGAGVALEEISRCSSTRPRR